MKYKFGKFLIIETAKPIPEEFLEFYKSAILIMEKQMDEYLYGKAVGDIFNICDTVNSLIQNLKTETDKIADEVFNKSNVIGKPISMVVDNPKHKWRTTHNVKIHSKIQ